MMIFGESRRLIAGLAAAALLTVSMAGGVGAQDTGGSGNGGASNANSDGGDVNMGDVESSGNAGSDVATIVSEAIAVGSDDLAATIIAQILGS